MEIITKVVWDVDLNIIERVVEKYDGPWGLCKGGASKQEQANADAQRNMENQLLQQQLGMQQQQLSGVNAAVDPIIQAITSGRTPTVLSPLESALTAQYMNQLPNTLRQGIGAINQNLVARGITGGQAGAGAGAAASNFGQLEAMLGALQQQGATNTALTLNDAKLNLLQNDLGLKLGVANQYGSNVGGFNQGAIGSLNAGVQAAHNVDEAQTSWMGPVFGALGGIGGGAFGAGGIFGKKGK